MNVVDELLDQRDGVLFGEWVSRPPRKDGEACLLVTYERRKAAGKPEHGYISENAEEFVRAALDELFPKRLYRFPDSWNDSECPDRSTALVVLDEAIRRAKATPSSSGDGS